MTIVRLDINVPENVTTEELEKFLSFKFLGHSVKDSVLSKFKHEELDVYSFVVEDL